MNHNLYTTSLLLPLVSLPRPPKMERVKSLEDRLAGIRRHGSWIWFPRCPDCLVSSYGLLVLCRKEYPPCQHWGGEVTPPSLTLNNLCSAHSPGLSSPVPYSQHPIKRFSLAITFQHWSLTSHLLKFRLSFRLVDLVGSVNTLVAPTVIILDVPADKA